jgi:hypothetical protein
METQPVASRSRLWPCIVLGLMASALALTSLWLALAPPSREIPSLQIAGGPSTVADCIARKLRADTPGNGSRDAAILQPQVSILTRDGSPTSQMIIEGTMQVQVVISLNETGQGRTEARLTTVPIPDPVPGLSKIIRACARH